MKKVIIVVMMVATIMCNLGVLETMAINPIQVVKKGGGPELPEPEDIIQIEILPTLDEKETLWNA